MAHKLERQRYRLLVDEAGTDTEHEVTVIHGDQIRGEATARSRKLPPLEAASLEHASIWVWHACRRQGITTLGYSEWSDVVLELERVKASNGDPELVEVSPTPASTG